MMVTEITLINCREYAWASGLALYREMNPSRARNTAAPEMSPTKRKIICTVLEYSFIFSYWPAPTVLPVMMPTAEDMPFIHTYTRLWSMPVMLAAAMTPAL